ncbi:hybrid sensor histidine kinase/response regulator [Luteitalea pratensis]|nr:ATP-binding protein [Luteitalea pratensis]
MTTTTSAAADPDTWILDGGGEMGEFIRATDWAATPLGPWRDWSRSLKATVAMLVHSRHPMFLWWGPDLIQIYNDAYVPSFGVGKHPAAMAQAGRACWPEIWHIIGPQIDAVMMHGVPSWHEDACVPIFRNGAIEDVYWTYGYSPVFDDDGSIGGTLVVCTETTARVVATRQEAALRAEVDRDRVRLQQFFAQAPAGICILRGADLTFEFANDHYRALMGGRDLVGKPLLTALPELHGQGLNSLLHEVLRSGELFVSRDMPVRLDRHVRGTPDEAFYKFIYSPLRDAAQHVDAVIVLALDVTDEVQAKQQAETLAQRLRDTEAQFHVLAETIPQLAWSTRPDGYIDWYNQRWYDYTGTTFDSMQGWGWRSVHDPNLVDDVVTRWQAALDAGEAFEMEFPLRGRDGQFRWHLTQAVPLKDDAGRVVRWFGTNTDIDTLRRASQERAALLDSEQRARQVAELASRAKDDFLATASHELRTPLNAILGWARMLQSGALSNNDYLRAVDSIERNAHAQVRLIEDILDGSRIITGKLHLAIRPLDLTLLVQAALDAVRPAADAKRIALTVAMDPAASRLVGDPDRLQQVVWNLVNNAIKFTPKDGRVDVSLRREGTEVQLTVRDTGEGIAADFLPHVFERFRQAEESTSRRHGGLGLGLALVRHLVEAHGGTVHAASDGPGRGATFVARLPVQAVFAEPATESPGIPFNERRFIPRPIRLAGVTVLVVDDEADARDLIATVLRSKGAEVITAATGAEALGLLASRPFTLMVSDIGMPHNDGYELIAKIRTAAGVRGLHLPAIALTAYSREQDRRRAIDAGFQAYVAKPVEPDVLVDLVDRLATEARREGAQTLPAFTARAEVLEKFARTLAAPGWHDALRFLNSRTAHRFTGLYRFDPPWLRSLALLDADVSSVTRGEDVEMDATYCALVGTFERPFTTEDTAADERLRHHPARDTVRSYCGVLLRTASGAAFGTLCHFDVVPCDVPSQEIALMEAAARLIMERLEPDQARSTP